MKDLGQDESYKQSWQFCESSGQLLAGNRNKSHAASIVFFHKMETKDVAKLTKCKVEPPNVVELARSPTVGVPSIVFSASGDLQCASARYKHLDSTILALSSVPSYTPVP